MQSLLLTSVICLGTTICLFHCGYGSSDKHNLPSVIFGIVDEAKPGTVIGNIPQKLWPDTTTSFSLILTTSSKFQRFNEYFSVTKNGTLIVEKLVDRDNVNEVCGPLDCCQAPVCWIDAFVMFLVDKTSSTTSILSLDSFANNRPSARLLLRISDVNDNPPRFLVDANDHAGFTISIQEGGKAAMETLPSAVDLDSVGNGVLEYRLTSADPRQRGVDVFKLTYQKPIMPSSNSSLGGTEHEGSRKLWKPSSPILVQLRDLDYEKVEDRRFDLLVTAIDGGFPALTGTLSVTVNLIDINDNAPVFLNTNASVLNLLENTTYSPNPIHQFLATDADSDENAHITYSLSPLNDIRIFEKFSVDAVTGSLYLTTPLDFEVYSERKLFVIAVASDRGSPRRSGTTTLTIVTQDVNDNLPTIIVQENVTVIEGMNYSKPVLRFYVKDEDLVSKDKVSCREATYKPKDAELVAGRALLRLQEVTANAYFLFTSGIFDYEETPRASLEIVCHDNVTNIASFGGDQVSETVIRITVAIGDANDNYPEFGFSEFVTRIPEHAIARTIVANLTARDVDTGINARITYSLMKTSAQTPGTHPSCDVLEALRIDSTTGLITIADGFCLDRERTNEVSVFVVAEDGGGLSTSVKLRIKLTDINDNPPLFEGPSLFAIRENFPEGFTVGLVRFTDADLNGNAVIQVQLSANNSRQVLESFDLVPSEDAAKAPRGTKKGVVTGKNEVSALLVSRTSFDRELMESFAVELVATDMGDPPLQTRKTVYVNVLDENDNAPVARFPLPGTTIGYHPKVHTNSPPGFEVCKLRATDPDKGENGTVTYELQAHTNGSRYFNLDRHSGRLSTAWGKRRRGAELDGTAPTAGVYCVQVLVHDAGVRPIKVPWEFFVLVSPRSPLFDTIATSPPELAESTADLGNRTTMHQKMSQMAGVMSLFAVVIFLVLIVSCVCMVRLAHRSKTKPRPPSPGAKENSPHAGAAFCPSSLGMIYTRSHMPLPESTVGGICTFSTMQPLKYGYGEPESWNMQGQEPCEGDCAFLEAQERLLPTPSAKEFYRPMQFESEIANRSCYSPMYSQFSL